MDLKLSCSERLVRSTYDLEDSVADRYIFSSFDSH